MEFKGNTLRSFKKIHADFVFPDDVKEHHRTKEKLEEEKRNFEEMIAGPEITSVKIVVLGHRIFFYKIAPEALFRGKIVQLFLHLKT